MDTISTFAVYDPTDGNATQYELLPSVPAPFGCKAWLHPLSGPVMCCCVKLQVHNVTGELNTTQSGINHMRATVDNWLAQVGLPIDDFQLSRIDYDYNFYLPAQVSEVLVETMQQLPQRAMSMSKADFPHSVYFLCKSRHAQLYRKTRAQGEGGQSQPFSGGAGPARGPMPRQPREVLVQALRANEDMGQLGNVRAGGALPHPREAYLPGR